MLQKKTFRRGIHPLHNIGSGKLPTRNLPVEEYVSDSVVIHMAMNIGAPATPIVQKGDIVKVGQKIGEAWANGNFGYAKDYFKRVLLETLNTNQHEEITFHH